MPKRNFIFIIFTFLFLFSQSCIRDLEKEGIYTSTTCLGKVIQNGNNIPVSNIRVILTNGDIMPKSVKTAIDGSFSIEITSKEINDGYYLLLEADSLYDSKIVNTDDIGFGKKEFDLGIIYIDGPDYPTVYTRLVKDITANSAIGIGKVTEMGKSYVSSRGFCWNTEQYPTIYDNKVESGAGIGEFEVQLNNLSVNTTYYVRAYATNGVGTSYSEQFVIKTLTGLPKVTTNAISNIKATSAYCGGNVTEDGGYSVTARGCCWSTNPEPTIENAHTTNGTDLGEFTSSIIGLQPNTTYYVRAYALNANGVSYGEQRTFKTASGLPVITTNNVVQNSDGSVVCGGVITSDGGFSVTARGCCYSTSPNPTTNGLHTTDGIGTGSFVSQLTNLVSGQTYYVRAYATNSIGTVYGEERVFVKE